MTRHVLRPGIDLDAGNDPGIGDGLDKRGAVLLLLADRLVVEDRATNGLTEAGRSHNQLPIGTPGLHGPGNPQLRESLVAGWSTFIHRQQALVIGDHRPRGVHKLLSLHLELLHFQFRISGKSWPYWSMYCLWSISLSWTICFR